MKITPGMRKLFRAIVQAKRSGMGDYEISEIFLVAMQTVSTANIRMRLTYPKPKKGKKCEK